MFDIFHLPENVNVQRFTGGADSSSASSFLHRWEKPRGARIVYFILIGAGGGGGKGFSAAPGNNRGGGAGGASGNMIIASYFADFIPDELYVRTPLGGKGADATAAATGGVCSVLYKPSSSLTGIRLLSTNNSDASIGANGSSSGSAAGGVGNSAQPQNASANVHSFMCLSYLSAAGNGGSSGGTATGGTPSGQSQVGNFIVTGGCGGGGVGSGNSNNAGSGIDASGIMPAQAGGAAGGGDGQNGMVLSKPTCFYGGGGGGSNSAGTGGRGGDGAYGCGGGGGGGGTTGGFGGKGGDAIAWVISI